MKEHLGLSGYMVLDARSRGAFVHSHIPGALHADFFHYLVSGTDPGGLREFHRELAGMLGKIGLEGKEKVVVYESGFGMRAARVAWMLQYGGMERVSMMEGGFRAWRRAGFQVETGLVHTTRRDFLLRPNPTLLATADSIVSAQTGDKLVLDVRSKGEYEGSEKRDCCGRYGRIPGARWLEWTQLLRNGEDFLSGPRIDKSLKELGLDRGKEVITYCHRGARAASAFYALRALGFRRVRNYIGSWHEWSSKTELPVETDPSTKP